MTDILQYAESGTYWKRIIYDIVSNEEFNPWDIDVGSLADSYMQKIKEIKMINFEVPGTIILVGSVLLKLKSDIVSGQTYIFEENLSADEEYDAEEDDQFSADLDDIIGEDKEVIGTEPSLLVRRIPKRKVTLPELITLLKRVVTQVEKKERFVKDREDRKIEIQLSKKNVERIMRDVYREIRRLSSNKSSTTFKELVDEWNRERVVTYFLPVLHLANRDKIRVEQEELYGEIMITPK